MFLKINCVLSHFKTQSWTFIVSYFFWLFLYSKLDISRGQHSSQHIDLICQTNPINMLQVSCCTFSLFSVWFRIFFCMWGKTSYSFSSGSRERNLPNLHADRRALLQWEWGDIYKLLMQSQLHRFPQSSMLFLLTEHMAMTNIFTVKFWCRFSGQDLWKNLGRVKVRIYNKM